MIFNLNLIFAHEMILYILPDVQIFYFSYFATPKFCRRPLTRLFRYGV